jgi:hypothetical protein
MIKPITMLLLYGVGLTLTVDGCSAQFRPRTNLEDDISWATAGLGVSLLAAAAMIHFQKPPQLLSTLAVAVLAPFVAYGMLLFGYWGIILLLIAIEAIKRGAG